ncbi:MAG: phosphate ABC transporter permease subunit PstC [Acidobacteria bacterium]|nr:phosphate ABC transporter permease subunit PstC [Acidobacteriota bacterium]
MDTTVPSPQPSASLIGRLRPAHAGDFVFHAVTFVFAFSVLVLIALMLFEMLRGSWLTISRYGLAFVYGTDWNPPVERFGALPFVYGTIVSSGVALVVAVPISIAVALFVTYQAPMALRRPVISVVELLAAIPSVAFGLWGIFVLVPFMRDTVAPPFISALGWMPLFEGPSYGVGMLTSGLILAIMITPIVTAVSRDVLAAVPQHQRDGALALGATQWEAVRVVFQYALPGITGAIILGLARAVGETMAVTMVIGNRADINASLFAPGYSMASVIANEFPEANSKLYMSALIEVGVLLFLVSFGVRALAQLLVWRATRGRSIGREG